MRYLLCSSALLLVFVVFQDLAAGQNGTGTATTTLMVSPTTITVGGSVGLTATVQPNDVVIKPGQPFARPTGTITFLDGNTALSTTPVPLSASPIASASATFQQTFGTPDPTITQWQGELTGDLNGDGVPDLLIYASTGNNSVSVQTFISNEKGGYSAGALQALNFSLNNQNVIYVPVLVDLNGDGKLDLLDGVQVAYGNGDGTFAQATPVSFLSSGFLTAYAADLNGDGKTDILAVNTLPALQPPCEFNGWSPSSSTEVEEPLPPLEHSRFRRRFTRPTLLSFNRLLSISMAMADLTSSRNRLSATSPSPPLRMSKCSLTMGTAPLATLCRSVRLGRPL